MAEKGYDSRNFFAKAIREAEERGVVAGASVTTSESAKQRGLESSGTVISIDPSTGIAQLSEGGSINVDHLVAL